MATTDNFAETFDHVVVLMMENRSFDNLLGFLYDSAEDIGAGSKTAVAIPTGQCFSGAQGQSNPNFDGKSRIAATPTAGSGTPFPDPGEYMANCMFQIYGRRLEESEYNDSGAPSMSGFVADYHALLEGLNNLDGFGEHRWQGDPATQCAEVMQCHSPETVPVLSSLARDFCVFDHWFCALPSATWPNRAFWHADTSYGFADNPDKTPGWTIEEWFEASDVPTLFSRLDDRFGEKSNSWCVYSDQAIPLTKLVHVGSLFEKRGEDYFRNLEYEDGFSPTFFTDCASGELPKYSFLEPHFLNDVDHGHWHNDMHPSKWPSTDKWILWGPGGPGSVPLGEQLLLRVYEAIRNSPKRDRTLFIIAFDEHGGCFDHVSPPQTSAPDSSTYYKGGREYEFDFQRLGPRVPMVMVSSHIASNSIVNAEMNHASFLKGMQEKWGIETLGPRQDVASNFLDALPLGPLREWQDLSHLYKPFPDRSTIREVDEMILNELQQLVLEGMRDIAGRTPGLEHLSGLTARTSGELQLVLRQWRQAL